MGRCCFGKIVFLLGVLMTSPVLGYCPLADQYRQIGEQMLEIEFLKSCAISSNDDESQVKLAEGYMQGINGLEQDEEMALFMYQLAAENGHAEAQVKLAEFLQSFDTSSDRRKKLKEYQTKLEKVDRDTQSFSGEILHPYTLLLLASERPENKWYYPSMNRSAPARTSILLQKYEITSEKRQAAMKDASRWKTRKLLEAAKEILADTEYPEFEKRLKNNTTRPQAMTELKERLLKYVADQQKERAQPL